MEDGKRIVIVGGGLSTVQLLKQLKKKGVKSANVTLIEPKLHVYYAVGAPRALVDEEFAARCFVPYASFFDGTHVQKFVEEVDTERKEVHCFGEDEVVVPYDVLVVAPGKSYAKPFRFNPERSTESNDRLEMSLSTDSFHPEVYSTEQLLEQLDVERKRVTASSKVVVVGGGATGVESAAEIKERFPDKTVVVYQSKHRLLAAQREVSDKDAAQALRKLQSLGVEVHLSTRYEEPQAGGPHDPSTYVLSCRGGDPLTAFMPKSTVTEEGYIKCDSNLNVTGQKYVFAMGDAVFGSDATVKTAQMLHAPLVAENVVRVLKQQPKLKKMGKLPGPVSSFYVVTLGHSDSVRCGMLGKMMGKQKEADFLLGRFRKELEAM